MKSVIFFSEHPNVIDDKKEALLITGSPEADLSWYPKQKLSILRSKLRGINPACVLLEELKGTKHFSAPYAKNLEAIVRGDESRVRRKMRQTNLPIADQIDCLIDMANDPNILGRTWTGWGPYA